MSLSLALQVECVKQLASNQEFRCGGQDPIPQRAGRSRTQPGDPHQAGKAAEGAGAVGELSSRGHRASRACCHKTPRLQPVLGLRGLGDFPSLISSLGKAARPPPGAAPPASHSPASSAPSRCTSRLRQFFLPSPALTTLSTLPTPQRCPAEASIPQFIPG